MEQRKVIPAGNAWAEKNIREFIGSPFSRIGEDWMLITAGNTDPKSDIKPLTASFDTNWNTMTASWGGLGVLWGKDVAFVFVRPSRYTFEFINAYSFFTLSFFDASYHNALVFAGAHSGRDNDKAAETGLTPIAFNDGGISFNEASDIITCRKIYTHDFDRDHFLTPAIETHYPEKDYHRMYVGEILNYRKKSN